MRINSNFCIDPQIVDDVTEICLVTILIAEYVWKKGKYNMISLVATAIVQIALKYNIFY